MEENKYNNIDTSLIKEISNNDGLNKDINVVKIVYIALVRVVYYKKKKLTKM